MGGILALLGAASPTAAEQAGERRVDQFLCKDLMRDSGTDRDVAVAFLHGYLLGRGAGAAFNLSQLRRESDAFIERCLDRPGEAAVEAMQQVKAGR
jgi:hypothetical protein